MATVLIGRTDPFGVKHLHIAGFQEDTPLGMAADLRRHLAQRLAQEGLILTPNRNEAQGILSGQLSHVVTRTDPTRSGVDARIPSYEISMDVTAQLTDPQGATLWRFKQHFREDFLPGQSDDPDDLSNLALITEDNRRQALRRLSQAAAREIYQHLIFIGSLSQTPSEAGVTHAPPL
ncbi:MAG: LPS assembly lipoprotein LptE [Myxococcota bacterium]